MDDILKKLSAEQEHAVLFGMVHDGRYIPPAEGDEEKALQNVRKKYEKNFLENRNIHIFLGTTEQYHRRKGPNPFIIIGVYSSLRQKQLELL